MFALRFLMALMLLGVFRTSVGFADASTETRLVFGVGQSLAPDFKDSKLWLKTVPSRAEGGELFNIHIGPDSIVKEVRLQAFSKSKAGKILVRGATQWGSSGTGNLEELYLFAKAQGTGIQKHLDRVMLPTGAQVLLSRPQQMGRLQLQIEAFGSNDASFLVELVLEGTLSSDSVLFTRAIGKEVGGGFLNEGLYRDFESGDLEKLMKLGKTPEAARLNGTKFSCTTYSKIDAIRADHKQRAYALGEDAVLRSESVSQTAPAIWTVQAEGLQMSIANRNGCGTYLTQNFVRMTSLGNLISEVVLDLESYIQLCSAAGYDTSATRELVIQSSFVSILAPRFVVGHYEYCRRIN